VCTTQGPHKAGKALADRVEDPAIKSSSCWEERNLNKALRQALELQAVLQVARPHKTNARIFWGS
jgi:hypothetical protein